MAYWMIALSNRENLEENSVQKLLSSLEEILKMKPVLLPPFC